MKQLVFEEKQVSNGPCTNTFSKFLWKRIWGFKCPGCFSYNNVSEREVW